MSERLELADDGWLSYDRLGAGRRLLCVHGGLGIDAATLRVPGITRLASAGCEVVIPDLRGHGGSSRLAESEYSHERWTGDLRALATALGWSRHAILGHSYGGFLALEYTLRWPELVDRLVLVATSAGPVPFPTPPCPTEAALRDFFRGRWPRYFAGEEKHWDLYKQLSFSAPAFRAAFERELPRYDVRSRVAGLTMPALLIVGDRDGYLESMRWLEANLPRARLEVIPGVGHLPFVEAPGKFVELIRDFLADEPNVDPAV